MIAAEVSHTRAAAWSACLLACMCFFICYTSLFAHIWIHSFLSCVPDAVCGAAHVHDWKLRQLLGKVHGHDAYLEKQ